MTADCYSTIRCPFCDARLAWDDLLPTLVTFHGEDGPKEMECDSCGSHFWIDERVSRHYGIGKTSEEADRA